MKLPKIEYSTQNPLGILAMFISFAYLAMVVSFTIGIDKLHGGYERFPIIYFLILFPIVIIAVFCWLIIKYNGKLYGPTDYRADETFVLMSGAEIDKKNRDKASEITDEDVGRNVADKKTGVSFMSYTSRYEVAQNKAISKIGNYLNIQFRENVSMKIRGRKEEFDAVGDGKYGTYFVECRYLPAEPSEEWFSRVSSFLNQRINILDSINISYRFFLALIVQSPDHKKNILDYFKEHNPGIPIYLFTKEELDIKD